MRKAFFCTLTFLLFFSSCSETARDETKAQPMVYEGMSAVELREVLGEPQKISVKSEIFNAQSMTKMSLEHWVYEKRTVLLINDTVKNPNLN